MKTSVLKHLKLTALLAVSDTATQGRSEQQQDLFGGGWTLSPGWGTDFGVDHCFLQIVRLTWGDGEKIGFMG